MILSFSRASGRHILLLLWEQCAHRQTKRIHSGLPPLSSNGNGNGTGEGSREPPQPQWFHFFSSSSSSDSYSIIFHHHYRRCPWLPKLLLLCRRALASEYQCPCPSVWLSVWVCECVSFCVQAFGTELNIVCCHWPRSLQGRPASPANDQIINAGRWTSVSSFCVSSLSVYVQFRWNGERRAGRVWLHWVYSFISRNRKRKRIGTSAEWSSSKWTQNCSILTANCYNAAGAAEGTSKMHTEYNWLLHIQATVSCESVGDRRNENQKTE